MAPEKHIAENFHHFSPPFLQIAQNPRGVVLSRSLRSRKVGGSHTRATIRITKYYLRYTTISVLLGSLVIIDSPGNDKIPCSENPAPSVTVATPVKSPDHRIL